jgi:long-chain acyl-CoA synthetase
LSRSWFIGENRKFPAALIVPAFAHLQKWCEIKSIPYTTHAEMVARPEVVERIAREVEELNATFSQHEQIKRFELVGHEWTIDGGELTATLKLRRKLIAERHQALIDKIYQNEG